MTLDESIALAVEKIKNADAILIHAGAGMSVDSGLPDFRSEGGFWKEYPILKKHNISWYSISDPDAFFKMPYLAWAFFGHRINLYRKTTPHVGYNQILKFIGSKKGGYFVFTSNCDGHFYKAGFDTELIEECHGSIFNLQCAYKCTSEVWGLNDSLIEIDETEFKAKDPLPRCENCGKVARPNLLLFGDGYYVKDRNRIQSEKFYKWMNANREKNHDTLIIEIGAGIGVPTVRNQSEYFVKNRNMSLIRINPVDFDVPEGQISIPLGALEAISLIYERLQE